MTGIKNKISAFGFPRLIIMAFLGLLIVLMFLMDIPAPLPFLSVLYEWESIWF